MRAIDAINPQSVNFKEAREAGITTCASGPGSLNVIGGQYACIKTVGNVIDDMVLDPYFAMKCALGENPKKGYETTRMGIAATLRNILFQAKAYAADPNHKFDMKLEGQALRGDPGSGGRIHQRGKSVKKGAVAREKYACSSPFAILPISSGTPDGLSGRPGPGL